MTLAETLLAIGAGILILIGVIVGFQKVVEMRNQNETIQAIYLLRMDIERNYTGSSYDGLNNALVVSAELSPKVLIRNGSLRTAWGDVTVEGSGSQFSITLADVSKSACQQFGRLSPDSWGSIQVNGSEVLNDGEVVAATLISACGSAKNTVVFTTP